MISITHAMRRPSAAARRPPIPSASRAAGGWRFLADPGVRADRQALFWRPDVDPNVVILTASRLAGDKALSFHVGIWPKDFVMRAAPGSLYGLLTAAKGEHRLFFPDPPSTGACFAALIPFDDTAPMRAEAALRLWHSLAGRAPPRKRSLSSARRSRVTTTLRALDGKLAGASYRTIAETLYGGARLEGEPWKTASLRDTTIRRVRAGLALMRGGYRQLLRAR